MQPSEFKWPIRNLGFNTNVTVFVSARNKGNERSSSNYSMSFTTPSCAQMLDDAPDPAICGETIVLLVFYSLVGCSAVQFKMKTSFARIHYTFTFDFPPIFYLSRK